MYLERVKSKGNYYIFLREYNKEVTYSKDKRITLYNFGRIDKALKDMNKWLKDISRLPEELKEVGCDRKDIEIWKTSLEARKVPIPS